MVKKRKEYHTAFFLADQRYLDKQIYEIVQNFMSRTRWIRNKELWAKYAIFLYLSGARRTEPFWLDPTISKVEKNGHLFYKVRRINEKHFEGRNPRREIISQTFVAWTPYEKSLFDFLLGGYKERTIDFKQLFIGRKPRKEQLEEFKKQLYGAEFSNPKGRNKIVNSLTSQISRRFSMMFKADIGNGRINIQNGNMAPHMLRHLRAYDLLVIKNLKESFVEKLIGWGPGMADYYADIKRSMSEREEISFYEGLFKERGSASITPS